MFHQIQNRYPMFPPGLEPRTFRVLGERDNHYTTETEDSGRYALVIFVLKLTFRALYLFRHVFLSFFRMWHWFDLTFRSRYSKVEQSDTINFVRLLDMVEKREGACALLVRKNPDM